MTGLSAPRDSSEAPGEALALLTQHVGLSSEPSAVAVVLNSANQHRFDFNTSLSSQPTAAYAIGTPAEKGSEMLMEVAPVSYTVNEFRADQFSTTYTSSDLVHVPIFDQGLFF